MSGTCQNCGSSEIEEDNGSIICTSCGTVLAESTITNDVAFEETRGGGAQAVGTFVKQGNSAENVSGIRGVNRTESSEQTFLKGKKVIQEIASQLRINQHCIDTAFNWFKMCVTRNFTRGRPRSHVAAACLYMTCRRQNTPHMLLDFSDVTQVNVYDLGRALNFLTRSLKINLPTTDPCLYILRFAVMLDLGEKQKDVVDLATRIVNRMKRDWLGMGRRPTGLCGAALLLAARAHNYNRSISDIVRVVHISESVIRKRLDEFASTPSGSELSIEEFNNVDLEHNEDPPAYQEAKKKIKEAQENSQLDEMTKQLEPVQREIEDELKKRLKSHPFAKMIVNIADDDVPELCNAADLIRSEVLESVYEEIEETTSNDESLVQVAPGPSLQSLGIIPGIRTTQSTFVKPWNMERHDGALDLTDIDDMEIESYLLTDSESKLKERMWMARNSHHLEEMERRRKLKDEEELKERENPKKRRKTIRKKDEIAAATPGEAMVQVIHEKKLSSKINYDVLREDDFDLLLGSTKSDEARINRDTFSTDKFVEIMFPEKTAEKQLSEIQHEPAKSTENLLPPPETQYPKDVNNFENNSQKNNTQALTPDDTTLPSICESLNKELPIIQPITSETQQSASEPSKEKKNESEGNQASNPPSRRMYVKARPNFGKAAKLK